MLWRHGQTQWNDSRRFQGQTDVALDDVGRAQASLAAEQLAGLSPQLIVTSDLVRAAETADSLASVVGIEARRSVGLRETHGGIWEGKYADDLKADPLYLRWLAGDDVPAGGSETRSQVGERARRVVDEITSELEPGRVAVLVSHGGTIRSMIGSVIGLPVDHWRVLGGLANCCWSVLEEGRSGWRLTEHNASSLPRKVLGDDR